MKIHELQLKKDLQQLENPEDVLRKYGWKVIGIGMNSAVAEHPNKNYVIKLFEDNSKYKIFVKFALEYKDNPHVPVFFRGSETKALIDIDEHSSMAVPGIMSTIPGTKYSYVRMEKLSKISEKHLLKHYAPEMMVLYLNGIKFGTTGLNFELRQAIHNKIIVRFQRMTAGKIANAAFVQQLANDDFLQEKLWDKMGRKPDEDWFAVVDGLLQLVLTLNIRGLDIHEDNVMLRGDTLVVTDPFY
jgi:hypothetical protein